MQIERILKCGERPHILVAQNGEVRSMEPLFLANLQQLEILLLVSKGFYTREISKILSIDHGHVRNQNFQMNKNNGKDRYSLMKVTSELSLLNTVALRGIVSCMDPKKIDKNLQTIEKMEKVIREKNDRLPYGIYPKRVEQPMPIQLGIFVPAGIYANNK